ncbi:hypothetical protein RR48_15093 [Papilio machaon]|uniref:Uncharacterized protein n=1 Tax=Papilio machaon TaxID=76193 RepID=A0A194R1Q7_PAPMA|nr:hypothetical protein RR48_15093 [Papilio machaon]
MVATPLIERTFHMKVQARKLFAHREGCEVILGKADDQLTKSRQEYRAAFLNYCNNQNTAALAAYYDSHNNYVQQLTATNAMIDQYHKHTLPTILQSRQEYRAAFLNYCNNQNTAALAAYYDSHNNYVQQLTATNAMIDQYHKHTLPTILQRAAADAALTLLQPARPDSKLQTEINNDIAIIRKQSELEEILTDVTAAVSEAIYQGGEIITDKCTNQLRRYESLCAQSRAVSSTADLAHLARALLTAQPPARAPLRAFLPPYPPEPDDPPIDVPAETMPPVLRGEMLLDRMDIREARLNYEQLRKDAQDLEMQIKQLQDGLDSLARIQSRNLESNLYSKVNEIQEDISLKKYDYRATQLHLAAVRAQWVVHVYVVVIYENIVKVQNGQIYKIQKQNLKNYVATIAKVKDNLFNITCIHDLVRYKINKKYVNNANKSPAKIKTKKESLDNDDDNIRYKLPAVSTKTKQDKKTKGKPKIKVNFWSKKLTNRLKKSETKKTESNQKHTEETNKTSLLSKPKPTEVKVRKQVSFLPSPLFSDNHVPMVTVPDDLTLQLNEEEANALHDDMNHTHTNNESNSDSSKLNESNNDSSTPNESKTLPPQVSPRSKRHKRSLNNNDTKSQGNENELEFFSKYVVQKLRKMETDQRIYSENLINTVLMLGQLGELNGKSKVSEP